MQIRELWLVPSDGVRLYAELRGRRVSPDEATSGLGYIVVVNNSERHKMHTALKQRNQELAALNQFARTVSDTLELSDIVGTLQAMLEERSDVPAGAIFVYDAAQNELLLQTHWGSPPFRARLAAQFAAIPIGGSHLEQVVRKQTPFFAEDFRTLPLFARKALSEATIDLSTFLSLPMVARSQVEGAIWLFNIASAPLSEDRIAYFSTLGQQAGIAMRSARLFAEVRDGQERLRLLTRKIVSAQEEERRRVSRELHDDAGQLLTALKLSLEMIREDLVAGESDQATIERLHRQLDSAIGLSEQTMAHIRGLVHNLRPTVLDDLGLKSALEGLCHDFSQRRSVTIHCHLAVDDSLTLPATVQLVAYRFLQEALTNVSKHAQAQHVQVSFEESAGAIYLTVEDDGIGFKMNPATEGMGVMGMRERLQSVGGRLEIFSKPNNGTRLIATIPADS